MSRRIICPACRDHLGPQHPEDVNNGWQRRIVQILARTPAGHGFTVRAEGYSEFSAMASLVCDNCGAPICENTKAYAVTMWRGPIEPDDWESEYSYPLTKQTP